MNLALEFNQESLIPGITHAINPAEEAARVRSVLEAAFAEGPAVQATIKP